MIIDKLGQIVKVNDRIVIAELKASNNFNVCSILSFATVICVNHNYLKVKYDIGLVDDCFVNKEFILLKSHNIYSMIENATFDLVGL